jgi:hypothetical protein
MGVVALAMLAWGMWLRMPVPFSVTVEMATTTPGEGQVFAGDDAVYTEQQSVRFRLRSDGKPHAYRVNFRSVPSRIRVDPGTGNGIVELRALRFSAGGRQAALTGTPMANSLRLLEQLVRDGDAAPGATRLRSLGRDPQFDLAVPTALAKPLRWRQYGGGLAIVLGFAGLLALALHWRGALVQVASRPGSGGAIILTAALAITIGLLDLLGVGCAEGMCSLRGATHGIRLLLAALALATIGGAIVMRCGLFPAGGRARLFLCLGVGQVALTAYIFVRSALHAAIAGLPLTQLELWVVVAVAAAFLLSGSRLRSPAPSSRSWLLFETGLLAGICLVVADRELPRVLMLSSDPDLHAYLARQMQLLGGIPWHGEAVFDYPAGSAALTVVWADLSWMGVGNALTALPLLQSFFAALVLAETVAATAAGNRSRAAIMLTALGVTGGGFLVPLYASYSHMEGTGRQVAIGFMALVPALVLAADRRRVRTAVAAGFVLFTLAVLNPVNSLLPCLLVAAIAIHDLFRERRPGWLPIAIALMLGGLLLDPYYQSMLGFADPGSPRLTLADTLHIKSPGEILASWRAQLMHRPMHFLGDFAALAMRDRTPLFAAWLLALGVTCAWLSRGRHHWRARWPWLVVAAGCVVATVVADALFAALADDRRFYLLSPYFRMSIRQHQILLLTALVAATMAVLAAAGTRRRYMLATGAAMVLVAGIGMRHVQPMALDSRWNYCGSLGCASEDDLTVLRRFAAYARGPGNDARVLLPNSIHHAHNEAWIFPVAGARAVPFAGVVPAAFFYYQGDEDYTTASYLEHVCRRFDRPWLKSQHIGFVFLPSMRDTACVQGMEGLRASERVLFRSGDSYLLQLR